MKRAFLLSMVMLLILFVSHSPGEAGLTGKWNVLSIVNVDTDPPGKCTYEGTALIVQDTPTHASGPVSMELANCEVVSGQRCFCPPVLYAFPPPPPPNQPLPTFNTDCTITGLTLNCTMAGWFPSQGTITGVNSIEGSFNSNIDDTDFDGNWTATRELPPVPAFSHWGMLLFALILLASAFRAVRRKKTS